MGVAGTGGGIAFATFGQVLTGSVRRAVPMASGQSKAAVFAGIGAAAGIATTKFIAAASSGSAAMLAEGIHSAVDTGDNLLLYLGQRRSARPANADHPFGHGP